MVAKYWFQIVDPNDPKKWVIKNQEKYLEQINQAFSYPNFSAFKQQFFTQVFCRWQVFGILWAENLLWDVRAKILDWRAMKINVDKYWDPVGYEYMPGAFKSQSNENFKADEIVDNIIYFDPDIPYLWLSLYHWLIYDALTDAEASKTNFYFFQNRARPDIVVMLTDEILQNQEELDFLRKNRENKFKWSENAYKPHIGSWIKDIKTLDMNNNNLQLLDLRKFIDTRVAITFWIDKRLVWYNVEWWGSRSERYELNVDGNVAIREYAKMFEDFVNSWIRKFLFKDRNYQVIAQNDTFSNDAEDKKIRLEMVKEWVVNRKEFREEFDMPTDKLPQEMERFTIPSKTVFIDWNQGEKEENLQTE